VLAALALHHGLGRQLCLQRSQLPTDGLALQQQQQQQQRLHARQHAQQQLARVLIPAVLDRLLSWTGWVQEGARAAEAPVEEGAAAAACHQSPGHWAVVLDLHQAVFAGVGHMRHVAAVGWAPCLLPQAAAV
jgi:hypothetical protein